MCEDFLKNISYDDLAFKMRKIRMRMSSFRYGACLKFRMYNDLCKLWSSMVKRIFIIPQNYIYCHVNREAHPCPDND